MYWLMERIPATRDGARRLGLVTLEQMKNALVNAVENPCQERVLSKSPNWRMRAKPAGLSRMRGFGGLRQYAFPGRDFPPRSLRRFSFVPA